MEKRAIGIDLGTTHSCVAVWQQGKIEIIANDQGNRITPSYVAFTDTERFIGDCAKYQIALNPKNTIFDAKRLIGRKFDDPLIQADMKHWPFTVVNDGGKPKVCAEYKGETKHFAPEEISSMILSKLKETAEAYLDSEVTDAVITVPAYFNDSQRQATKDAGAIAGLNVLRIINEPTAATLAYGLDQNLKNKRNILTFDLGGGTFDVSVLTVNKSSLFEVLSTAGDTHLGGEDFDNRLVNYLAEEFKKKHKKDLTVNSKAVCRLRTAAEKAKCILSSSAVANVAIDSLFEGIDFYTQITRPKFEDICFDLFQATLVPVEKALTDANLDKSKIDDVVLVGGSTRIPKVQSLLQNFFLGKSLKHSLNPDEAVAYGAAVQAASLSGGTDLKGKDILLMDVTPLSLGVEINYNIMDIIIKRNSRVPCTRTNGFSNLHDNQTTITFPVYEGERVMSKDNNLLGMVRLSGITPAPRGETKIDITFDLDVNGILNVTVKERGTGKLVKTVITNERGRLSKEEIDRMVKDAKRFKEEDDKHRIRFKARTKLENYAYKTKQKVNEAGSKLSAIEKNSVKKQCEITLNWLDNNRLAGLMDYKLKLQEMKEKCQPIMNKISEENRLLD